MSMSVVEDKRRVLTRISSLSCRLSRFLVLILAPLLGNLVFHAAAQQISAQELSSEGIRSLKLELVDRINTDRQAAGLQPVTFFDEISQPADEHCREMLALDYTSHWNQEGLKPYMRYSMAGIIDHTAENIASLFDTRFKPTLDRLEREMANRHDSFMSEKPPNDLHRRAVLDPWHTHVGIGMAYGQNKINVIEVFANRYVEVKRLPSRASLSDKLLLLGKILFDGFEVQEISIHYESLPEKQSVAILRSLVSYGLPDDRLTGRPVLPKNYFYEDGSTGDVKISGSNFSYPISFFRKKPGVYTIVVWLKKRGAATPASYFIATNICVFVEK